MPKTTTIDHTSVLEMALVGYQIERSRIEAAIAEIQAGLGHGDSSRPVSTATDNSEPKETGKKRFSVAARKRMAAAQKKRWQLLKAKKAPAKKTKPVAPGKRQNATAAAPGRKPAVQVVKTTKPKTRKSAPAVRRAVANPEVQESVTPLQSAVEPAPTEATV